jgi:ATP-dependent Clp protease ATP-binding subunit ClpC
MDFTPRASQILALASQRARDLGHDYVGVEHLLLALCEEPEGVAAHALRETGGAEAVREKLFEIFRNPGYNTPTRLVGDSHGRLLGRVETGADGQDVFVDLEGRPRPWPHLTE